MRRFVVAAAILFAHVLWLAADDKCPRRKLNVALYPYIPEKAELYWKLEQQFEDKYPCIDLRYVETGDTYYSSDPAGVLQSGKADVAEVDTVLLADLVSAGLVAQLPQSAVQQGIFFPVAESASKLMGKTYGVPHWVCGNFLFFRKDDPKRDRLEKVKSLLDLEKVVGRPVSQDESLLIDLRGRSTLGETYLDAMLDLYGSPDEVLKRLSSSNLDPDALRSLDRLFALCPGGLCDSDKHHQFSPFYARQFTERKARVFIGYSERLFFVIDDYLNGVRDDQSAVGKLVFDDKTGDAIGTEDIGIVPATVSDKFSTMLSWVDVLCIRATANEQTKKDAEAFIDFFNSEAFTLGALIPEYGHAPRYLLSARLSVYQNPKLLKAAPLYPRFCKIMMSGISMTHPNLNPTLRDIGKKIQDRGFDPVR